MAHVRAARHLVPAWLEQGQGRFIVTASAAGLLTMLGDAPYSVTKHGAVAFAEWLSATYGSQGIDVHAICPLAVSTPMYENSGPLRAVLDRDPVLDPQEVADALMGAMDDGRFLVLPHPQAADYYAFRAQDPDRWLRGMRKIQSDLPRD
jgi:NAD(P)-dependent dehydrogenase (short-subunit alcohol dehydrogenase family)